MQRDRIQTVARPICTLVKDEGTNHQRQHYMTFSTHLKASQFVSVGPRRLVRIMRWLCAVLVLQLSSAFATAPQNLAKPDQQDQSEPRDLLKDEIAASQNQTAEKGRIATERVLPDLSPSTLQRQLKKGRLAQDGAKSTRLVAVELASKDRREKSDALCYKWVLAGGRRIEVRRDFGSERVAVERLTLPGG